MAQVYRETRYSRDSSPSGDEGYRRTTTRRYKQAPSHSRERVYEREIDVIDDDRQGARLDGRFYGRPTGGELVVDRRDDRLYPDRPRSTAGQGTTYVERRYRETEDWDGDNIPDRERTVVEKRLVTRNDDDYHYRHDSSRNRDNDGWERHSYYDAERDAEVRVERKVERREDGSEVILERRIREHVDHDHGADVEIYRKETEYYEPAPQAQPIVIRQRPAEQRIIVQEAAPPTVVVRERRDDFAPYVVEKTEEEYIVEHIDDHPHSHSRHRDGHHSHSRSHHRHEGEEYYAGATRVSRRDERRSRSRSSSGSPHRKRHIAEGALAGAGVSALIASRRNKETGEVDKHRGTKIVAGAALGALGTEAVRRAHSAYKDRHGDSDNEHDRRSRSRSRSHSRIKTGLGIAAVALAAAGAAKYYESKKIEKEEAERGRPSRRYSESDYSRSPSRKRSKSRAGSVAKAALGTAAAVGVVQHYRHKRSKSRHGSRSRSSSSDRSGHHSKLKTGAEIVAAGVAGAAAKKMYDKHKEKKERSRSRHAPDDRDREFYDDDGYNDHRDRDYKSRSRSRSQHRSALPSSSHNRNAQSERTVADDPESLGLVEYGTNPVPVDSPKNQQQQPRSKSKSNNKRQVALATAGAAAVAAAAATAAVKHNNEKNNKRDKEPPPTPQLLSAVEDYDDNGIATGYESAAEEQKEKERERERRRRERSSRRRQRERERDDERGGALLVPRAREEEEVGYYSDSEDSEEERMRRRRAKSRDPERERERKESRSPEKKPARSKSRLGRLAAGAAAAGAAAIGIKKLGDNNKDKKEKEKERERERDREKGRDKEIEREERDIGLVERRNSRDSDRERMERQRERERERRRYEEQTAPTDPFYQQRPASPPHASGGYPPVPPTPPAVAPVVASVPTATTPQLQPHRSSNGFTQLPNINFTDVNQFQTPYPMGPEAMPMPVPGPAPVQQQPVQQPQQQYQQYQPYNPQDYVASYPPPPPGPPGPEVPPALVPGKGASAAAPPPPASAPRGVSPPQEVPPALRAPQGVPASLMVGAPSHLSQSQSQSVIGRNRPEDVSTRSSPRSTRDMPMSPTTGLGDERDGREERRRSMHMSRSRPRRSRGVGVVGVDGAGADSGSGSGSGSGTRREKDGLGLKTTLTPPTPTDSSSFSSPSETDSPTPNTPKDNQQQPPASKSVTFIPLSPKSSQTLQRHHEGQMAKEAAKRISGVDPDDNSDVSDFEDRLDRELNALVPAKYRSAAPVPESSNSISRRGRFRSPSSRHHEDSDDSDSTLEILPDRFDKDGRPLDSRDRKMHTRRGGADFLYHDHHGNGLKQIAGTGQWGISGTDDQAVERIVKKVEGVLEGKGSWTGLVMGLLSGRLMEGDARDGDGSSEVGREVERPKRRRRGMARLGV